MINTGGIKVVPERIEEAIQKVFNMLKLGNRFIVGGIADKKLGQKVCLIVETHTGINLSVGQLREIMRDSLSHYETPREILFVKKFIETETGKINRKATIHLFPV